VLLYAHRGANRRAPENTLAAFRIAIEQQADGVELDVRTAQSGEVVVAHDPHFGRLADRAAWVARSSLARLRRIDLGGGERVPLLDEAIDLIVGGGLRLNVEVKSDVPDRRATARAVVELLRRRSERERSSILLSTFDPVVFRALKRAPVPRAFLLDPSREVRAELFARVLRPDGVNPHHGQCTPERVRAWKRRGLVSVWTVNDPQRARELAQMGVDAIITDDVPLVRSAL
jgi:glycerophosphoryl diester phosphodiesterase